MKIFVRNYEHPCFQREDRQRKETSRQHTWTPEVPDYPMSPEPFVSRAKAPPAKRSEKGYGDENGFSPGISLSPSQSPAIVLSFCHSPLPSPYTRRLKRNWKTKLVFHHFRLVAVAPRLRYSFACISRKKVRLPNTKKHIYFNAGFTRSLIMI